MNEPGHTGEHVGEIGQRITLTGTVRTAARVRGFTDRSPDRALIVIDTETARVKFVTASWRWYQVKRGDQITISGTVKAHTEWRGTKQTVLTRVIQASPPANPDPTVGWEAVNPTEAGPRPFPRQTHALAPAPDTPPGPAVG